MDHSDFQKYYAENVDFLVFIAKKHRLSDEVSDEFVQEAFTLLLSYKKEIDPSRVRGFLVTTLRNLIIDHFRSASQKLERKSDPLDSVPETRFGAATSIRPEIPIISDLVLEYSSKKGGQEFGLFYGEGISTSEIARRLNKPEGSVRSQISRFRRRFQRAIRKELEERLSL
ncbi:RNA polymerase sigma factor [Pseudobacteriovorax antillogorgiicola]|uniref:RNA polymerase sigma factor, sigma-70 family n=1 Tax=Pseudobacteriovorax antillogorgiicola TaxID=1513793 RepID=A0A1Y6BKC1_9BACT|nr:sigma-70 family RNA polymerase sigma factor [Pseudobacteriovorax antillogorgiicola]TCS54713.1 RNA polymerase sigma factor (sigma-70 family) [Pseudobacteriovorax antillogorgiicola]SMF16111.1 RNA polymerase sigma factor, sigma-70 family [Pseudobacteriovorax antillogorgiicola]